MNLWLRPLVAALLLAGIAAAQAADMEHPDRLAGEMFIAGATLVDPPPGEAPDSRAYFKVTGAAARTLYQQMKSPATKDECVAGRRFKTAGALTCSAGAKPTDVDCDFAIDLKRGTLAPGAPC